jgi:DNA-directed RNA polymerase subunit RPC12/RpoP
MSYPRCPRCGRFIAPEDTIEHVSGEPAHADCRQPRGLSHEERTLLFRYCGTHEVAACVPCGRTFRQEQLSIDIFSGLIHLCPRCSADLSESLRGHLYSCPEILSSLRQRAQEARDEARKLVKESHQSRDRADVLIREAEAAIAALRETMRQNWNWKG